jgi:NAD(P)-dependent dehydrogenase (short-subunit alcohol dehydrogenase family)
MKTIVITGGTSGIGLELVNWFANHKWNVIFTGRSEHKAEHIIRALHGKQVYFEQTDFASFDSIAQAAEHISARYSTIDVLINNAGTWEMSFSETKDGIETNFAVNHLAAMLFTLTLLPKVDRQKGRIITTSSGAHRRNILDFDDLEWRTKPYDGVATYSQSKLCNILFTKKLAELLTNTGILVNSVHPGYVKTNLFNKMGNRGREGIPNAADGARSAIFAATDSEVVNTSDLYIFHETIDPNRSPLTRDEALARRLWEKSLVYLKDVMPVSAASAF